MKLTIIELLTMNLRKHNTYCKNLHHLTTNALQDEQEMWATSYAKAEAACKNERGILRIPPYWMQARAKAAAAELARRAA